jgi:hypothetical protein
MIITAFNIETDDLEKSYIVNDFSAGITSIEVKNNNRFSANDRILIGGMGQEKSEVVTVSSVDANGTTLVIGATKFAHSTDDPVYKLTFDQVKFYRASSSGGSYSVISTQDMDVDNFNLTTIYDDTTGTSSNYYKFTFYHSISTVESAFSDEVQASGWRREQVGKIIDEILQEVSDPQEMNITRNEILGYFNDVNDDLQINVSRPYDFLKTRTTLTRTANTNYVDYPEDSYGKQTMWKFSRMDYNFTDTDTDPDTDNTSTITVISSEEFRNLYPDNTISTTTVSDDKPEAMTLDDYVNRFRFSHPFETTASNVFYLHYWKYFTEINSEGDVIETPTPKIYKLYSKAMYYRKRGVTEPSYNAIADRFSADYIVEKNKYTGINGKDKGTPKAFRPVSSNMRSYRR